MRKEGLADSGRPGTRRRSRKGVLEHQRMPTRTSVLPISVGQAPPRLRRSYPHEQCHCRLGEPDRMHAPGVAAEWWYGTLTFSTTNGDEFKLRGRLRVWKP
jgi:hypothetical protein